MSELTDWAIVRCEKHDMVSCADCLEQKRMRRAESGEVRYSDDCAVDTFAEITGVDYDFAAEVLREAGAKLGTGTRVRTLAEAFASVGLKAVHRPELTLETALIESRDGSRDFYVCGFTRSKRPEGHAWTIQNGKAARDYFRYKRIIYRIYEVTA